MFYRPYEHVLCGATVVDGYAIGQIKLGTCLQIVVDVDDRLQLPQGVLLEVQYEQPLALCVGRLRNELAGNRVLPGALFVNAVLVLNLHSVRLLGDQCLPAGLKFSHIQIAGGVIVSDGYGARDSGLCGGNAQ